MAVLPLLQPVALARSTRHALRRRRDVLPAVRKILLAAVPGGEVPPVQLERIRPRTLVTLVASVTAAYLLAGELAGARVGSLLRTADWRWGARRARAVGDDLRGRDAFAVRVRHRAAELCPHSPRPARQLFRHAGNPRRCRRCGAERSVPAAQEDTGARRGRQRRRVPGGGLRPAHPASCHIGRDRGSRNQERDQAADVGLLRGCRAGGAGRHGARHPGRPASGAGAPVANLQPGLAATGRGRPASAKARRGHRRHAAAQPRRTSCAWPPASRRSAGRFPSRGSPSFT